MVEGVQGLAENQIAAVIAGERENQQVSEVLLSLQTINARHRASAQG